MQLIIILFLSLSFLCIDGQTTTDAPNYFCSENDGTVEFTWSSLYHSAWNPTSNCLLQQCTANSSNNNTCRSSSTLCYHYHTHNNISHCAPGILCSILEPCNNITNTCASMTSVCVVNSCCSSPAVCLPLSWTNFCILDETITTTDTTTSTSHTSSTTSTSHTHSTTSTSHTSSTTSKSTSTTTTSSTSSISTTAKTSTTMATTTINAVTTPYSCFASAPASLATFSGSIETNWTRYEYNHTATKTDPLLIFGVEGHPLLSIMIDDVSIINITNPFVELLINPGFDNSTASPPIGWSIWCTCSAGSGGTVVTSDCRVTGNCYRSQCYGGFGIDYLVQTFSAVVGHVYTISFWFQRERSSGSSGTATLYVDII